MERPTFFRITVKDSHQNSLDILGVGHDKPTAITSAINYFSEVQKELGPLEVIDARTSVFEPKSFNVKPSP